MSDYAKIGKVVPLHRGSYDAGTEYRINDVVEYQKSTYWHKGIEATTGVPPTDEAVWELMLSFHASVDPLLQAIEDKGAETLAKIPENYADLDALAKRNEEGIGELKDDFSKIESGIFDLSGSDVVLDYDWIEGKKINNDGIFIDDTKYHSTDFIPIRGKTITFIDAGYTFMWRNKFFTKDKSFISDFSLDRGTSTIDVPENAAYYVLSVYSEFTVKYPSKTYTVEKLKENIEFPNLKREVVHSENRIDYVLSETNAIKNELGFDDVAPISLDLLGYVKDDGTIFEDTTAWHRSDFVEIVTNKPLVFDVSMVYGDSPNAFYDINKQFISSFTLVNGTNTIDVPDNARYYIVSVRTTDSVGLCRKTVIKDDLMENMGLIPYTRPRSHVWAGDIPANGEHDSGLTLSFRNGFTTGLAFDFGGDFGNIIIRFDTYEYEGGYDKEDDIGNDKWSYIRITPSHIYSKVRFRRIEEIEHGLNISGYLIANISDGKINLTSGTQSVTFDIETTYFCYGTVRLCSDFALNNVVWSLGCTAINHDIWMIGDSYFGHWAQHLITEGKTNNSCQNSAPVRRLNGESEHLSP